MSLQPKLKTVWGPNLQRRCSSRIPTTSHYWGQANEILLPNNEVPFSLSGLHWIYREQWCYSKSHSMGWWREKTKSARSQNWHSHHPPGRGLRSSSLINKPCSANTQGRYNFKKGSWAETVGANYPNSKAPQDPLKPQKGKGYHSFMLQVFLKATFPKKL